MQLPTIEQVERAKEESPWDLGNKILYDLCKRYPLHRNTEEILAKVWLIGRAYAVAVERRKNKKQSNDTFYVDTICPIFKEPNLDTSLEKLHGIRKCSSANIGQILQVHCELMRLLNRETNLNKRSFGSKYLHFHFPNLFFLYDTRAVSSLRRFVSRVPDGMKYFLKVERVDKEYSTFFCKCYYLREQIRKEYGLDLTPRQLDNLLIAIANSKGINR